MTLILSLAVAWLALGAVTAALHILTTERGDQMRWPWIRRRIADGLMATVEEQRRDFWQLSGQYADLKAENAELKRKLAVRTTAPRKRIAKVT